MGKACFPGHVLLAQFVQAPLTVLGSRGPRGHVCFPGSWGESVYPASKQEGPLPLEGLSRTEAGPHSHVLIGDGLTPTKALTFASLWQPGAGLGPLTAKGRELHGTQGRRPGPLGLPTALTAFLKEKASRVLEGEEASGSRDQPGAPAQGRAGEGRARNLPGRGCCAGSPGLEEAGERNGQENGLEPEARALGKG